MVAYLTDASLTTVTGREVYVSQGGLKYLLNPCTRLDTLLYLGQYLGVVSNLEYKCSVTQSPLEDYCYVKCWGGGPILRADPRRKDESGNTQVVPKVATLMFLPFPVFLVPQIDPLPVFNGLAVFCQRVIKIHYMPGKDLLRFSYKTSWLPI